MNIDVSIIIDTVKDALIKMWQSASPKAIAISNIYLEDSRVRLESLALNYAKGEVDLKFLLDRLDDERDILKTKLLSFEVIGLEIAQEVANTVISILEHGIQTLAIKYKL